MYKRELYYLRRVYLSRPLGIVTKLTLDSPQRNLSIFSKACFFPLSRWIAPCAHRSIESIEQLPPRRVNSPLGGCKGFPANQSYHPPTFLRFSNRSGQAQDFLILAHIEPDGANRCTPHPPSATNALFQITFFRAAFFVAFKVRPDRTDFYHDDLFISYFWALKRLWPSFLPLQSVQTV